jgi:hypothetical protein
MTASRRKKLVLGLGLLLIAAVYVGLSSILVHSVRPNQDEGWYLYAATLVRQHKIPYLDFAYVQPPLLPYVYAALGGDRSVEAGRLVSALFGALAVVLCGLAAARGGVAAGLLTAMLLAFCAFAETQQSIVKTYALANAGTAGGLALAMWAKGRPRWVVAAAMAFSLAALTRNSVATALLAYWLWLAGSGQRVKLLKPAVAGGVALPLLVYMPLALINQSALYYNLIGHHAAQAAAGSGLGLVLIAAVALAQLMVQAAPVLALAVIAGLALQRRVPAEAEGRAEVHLLTLMTLLVGLGHLVSKHPYQEYQALALPPAVVLAGVCWGRILSTLEPAKKRPATLAALALAVLPLLGFPHAAGYHRETFAPLRQVVFLVQAACPADEPIFTFQTDVAVEAQRKLVPGLTLASFSLVETDDEARHLHLMSLGRMREDFALARPAVVVLSPGDLQRIVRGQWTADDRLTVLETLSPADQEKFKPIVDALDHNYRLVGRVPGVGQFAEEFAVLARVGPRLAK